MNSHEREDKSRRSCCDSRATADCQNLGGVVDIETTPKHNKRRLSEKQHLPHFTSGELYSMLATISGVLPIVHDDWKKVVEVHNQKNPGSIQTVESIKGRFFDLFSRKEIPTKDPTMRYSVKMSKKIQERIIKKRKDLRKTEDTDVVTIDDVILLAMQFQVRLMEKNNRNELSSKQIQVKGTSNHIGGVNEIAGVVTSIGTSLVHGYADGFGEGQRDVELVFKEEIQVTDHIDETTDSVSSLGSTLDNAEEKVGMESKENIRSSIIWHSIKEESSSPLGLLISIPEMHDVEKKSYFGYFFKQFQQIPSLLSERQCS